MDIKPSIPSVSVIGGGRSSLLAAALVAALAKPAQQAQVLQPGAAGAGAAAGRGSPARREA